MGARGVSVGSCRAHVTNSASGISIVVLLSVSRFYLNSLNADHSVQRIDAWILSCSSGAVSLPHVVAVSLASSSEGHIIMVFF